MCRINWGGGGGGGGGGWSKSLVGTFVSARNPLNDIFPRNIGNKNIIQWIVHVNVVWIKLKLKRCGHSYTHCFL